MDNKFFILIEEEMKKHRAYDSIGDWPLDKEKNLWPNYDQNIQKPDSLWKAKEFNGGLEIQV